MTSLEDWGAAVAEFGGRPSHWLRYNAFLYRDVSFAGKRVLDVGGGVGRASYYAAAAGAKHVVCVEPEAAGSENTMIQAASQLGERLGMSDRVELVAKPIEDVGDIGQFDIVLSHNSINHLDEEACSRLHFDVKARRKYLEALSHIGDLTKTGGQLVLTDCSNRNLFAALGIQNPFAPSITWRIHQPPELWAELFSYEGFEDPTIRWTPDRRSGWLGKTFLANRWASYCLQSHFCMTMWKR